MNRAEQSDPPPVSRRTIVRSGAAATVAGAVAGAVSAARPAAAQGDAHGPGQQRDLVLTNGSIHLMNARHDVVRVLAIREGRVAYTGNSVTAALRAVPERPRVLDLRGRTAIPGIIDNHNHLVLMGNRPGRHTPLENAYSIADVQRIYRARAQKVPAGEFVTTIGGFHVNQFSEVRLPTLAELDAAVPNHPAYISVGFSGPSVTNSRGRAFFETVALPVVVGADGAIAAGQETGKATLALRRTLTAAARRRGALDAMAYATGLGVTTHLDQGAFQATGTPSDGAAHEDNYTMHLPFLGLYAEGRASVRLRINFLHMDTDPALPTLTDRLDNSFPFFGDDMVRTGGIGEFIAQGLGPTWLEAARRVARAGWRAEVHSLSQTDFRTEIEGFEPDENGLGTLDVGRHGDVAVLDRDYFTVPDAQLRQVSSVLTVVGGAIVHGTGKVD